MGLSACALSFGGLLLLGGRAADLLGRQRAGDEGFRAGGWVGLIGNSPQLAKLALDEALAAGAFLLGRRSYEWLAARWPSRSGELADRLNSLPKYVVSSTLEHPAWNNSTVLGGNVLNEVSTLKQQIDGDIVIAGSFQLVHTLMEQDLADELRGLHSSEQYGPSQVGTWRDRPGSDHTAAITRSQGASGGGGSPALRHAAT